MPCKSLVLFGIELSSVMAVFCAELSGILGVFAVDLDILVVLLRRVFSIPDGKAILATAGNGAR